MVDATQSGARQAMVVAQYRSEMCFCGAGKKPRHSFCTDCWHALPQKLRKPLFGTFGTEYELAYLAAADWLAKRLKETI